MKLIAEVGNIPYKFTGIKYQEWPQHKSSTRYGQLPYLKVNDHLTLYQTMAIARFLAQECGLYPSDRIEATQTEEYMLALDDVFSKFVKIEFQTPKEKREEEIQLFKEGSLRTIFGALNKVLEANGGYLTGKLNWADLFFFEVELIIEKKLSIDVESVAPELKKLREHVMANEKAKTYLESERNLKRHS